jgi:hypothetical protein
MFDWISHNRQVFLQDYTRVGDTHAQVLQLQVEHSKFTDNSMVSSLRLNGFYFSWNLSH